MDYNSNRDQQNVEEAIVVSLQSIYLKEGKEMPFVVCRLINTYIQVEVNSIRIIMIPYNPRSLIVDLASEIFKKIY